jgi:hypothetical protein
VEIERDRVRASRLQHVVDLENATVQAEAAPVQDGICEAPVAVVLGRHLPAVLGRRERDAPRLARAPHRNGPSMTDWSSPSTSSALWARVLRKYVRQSGCLK